MHVLHVVGARPNFMKLAPVFEELKNRSGVKQTLLHTGQHYDYNMSDVFFRQLQIPEPDVNLEVGSGSHARQTSEIMIRLEPVLLERKPDLVLVYGDVNSTMASALVCSKLLIPLGHVEAGLRSFDRTMPEEINRLVTDQLANLLFTPSEDGNQNLARENVAADKIHLVGNVMIDTLVRFLACVAQYRTSNLPEKYLLVTLHRPANVDDLNWLAEMIAVLEEIGGQVPVLFPIHPRTRLRMAESRLTVDETRVRLLEPLPYLQFLALQTRATAVITDSGGIQEETTYLQVPCLTMRDNTERPITITVGTNILVGRDVQRLRVELRRILGGDKKRGSIPPLWDGHAARRIADVITRA